jgi:plasmid maintenance system killer protein
VMHGCIPSASPAVDGWLEATAEVVADLARSPERLAASAIAKAAVWVDANWRLVFAFEGEDAVLVDYTDYH